MTTKEKLLYRYEAIESRIYILRDLGDSAVISLAEDIDNLYWDAAKHLPSDERRMPRELDKTISEMKGIGSIKKRSQLSTHKGDWKKDLSMDYPVIKRMIDLIKEDSSTNGKGDV